MTFSTVSPSRNPVLSIRTQSEDAAVLRAEIEAANTQQQRYKRHRISHGVEPPIEEESDTDELDHDGTYATGNTPRPRRRSISSSLHSITGTFRGELSSARRFLKKTSLRPLNRMRPRTGSSACSYTSKQSDDFQTCLERDATTLPAELSCDPSYHQLEDNQRISVPSEESQSPFLILSEEQKTVPVDGHALDHKTFDSNDLSAKSLPCDNCQQPIRGGDYYDFCVGCRPSDRILCMTCARQRKCWRHRSDPFSLDDLLSARSSPAPPYTRPEVDVQEHGVTTAALSPIKQLNFPIQNNFVDPKFQNADEVLHDTKDDIDAKAERMDRMTKEARKVLQALKKATDQQVTSSPGPRERSLQEKEASLRDQFAAIREERAAVKEQELLVREREQLSREKEALIMRNLQSLVTIQELSRGGFIGAQFPSLKKVDEDRPQYAVDPLARSKSQRSHDGISLDDLSQANHQPKPAVASVVAQAEATINEFVLDDKHIRNVPGQKRKKEGTSATASLSPSSTQSVGQTRSSDKYNRSSDQEHDEDDEDNGSVPPKKQKQDSSDPDSPQRIYACPYFKHDRVRYSPLNMTEKHYRGCAGHYLHDIPRLKQHLRRRHWRPEHHCERCFKVFSQPSQLSEHLGRFEGCSKKECPFPEKMDKAQKQQVHVKRPRVQAETLWYDIYRVLFPGSPLPESPYVEEDEMTPPTSAAPSSASPEEATQRMIQIFNERLDKHKTRPEHNWLSSTKLRQLIDSELAESMSELFNSMSLTPNTPQVNSHSQPPSIMVSPVTPPPRFPASQQPPRPEVSDLGLTAARPSQQDHNHQTAPLLKEPKPRHVATHQEAKTDRLSQLIPEGAYDESTNFVPNQPPNIHNQDQFTDFDISSTSYPAIVFPRSEPVDNGWDDQSGSFRQGDDQGAMRTMVPDRTTSPKHLKTPRPGRHRHTQSFVPVRLEALKEPSANQPANIQQLQPQKSVASLVDSGYGSGTSQYPGPRIPDDDDDDDDDDDGDTDMTDETSPSGHVTFAEMMQQIETELDNPW